MLDQHNANRAQSLSLSLAVPSSLPCSLEKKTLMPVVLVHSTPHNTNTHHTRSIALSLSRGPLLPPLLPQEKNPNPNPRIQNPFENHTDINLDTHRH